MVSKVVEETENTSNGNALNGNTSNDCKPSNTATDESVQAANESSEYGTPSTSLGAGKPLHQRPGSRTIQVTNRPLLFPDDSKTESNNSLLKFSFIEEDYSELMKRQEERLKPEPGQKKKKTGRSSLSHSNDPTWRPHKKIKSEKKSRAFVSANEPIEFVTLD